MPFPVVVVPWELLLTYSYVLLIGTGIVLFVGYHVVDSLRTTSTGREEIELVDFAALEGVADRWEFTLQNRGDRTAERIHVEIQERTRQRKPLATEQLEPFRDIEPGDTVAFEYEIQETGLDVLELRIDCPGPNDRRIEFRRYGFDGLDLESDERTVFA